MMKIKLIWSFFLLLCFCYNTYAQPNRLFRHELSKSFTHTPSCWINDEKLITCESHYDDGNSRISIVNVDGNCREVMMNDIFISDLTVDNDTLFFCGRGEDSIKGLIGYAYIEELFYGSGTYTIFDNFIYYPHTTVSEFNKIISYVSSTGERHIVCIIDGVCLVDFTPYSTNNYNYSTVSQKTTSTFIEASQDIAYVPGNIVLSSMEYTANQTPKLVLRVFDSSDPITPYMNTVKHVYSQIAVRTIKYNGAVMTAMPSQDMFAVRMHTDRIPSNSGNAELQQSFISLSLFNPWALWDTTHVNSYAMLSTIECEQDNYQQRLFPLHLNWNDATQELIAINGLNHFSMMTTEGLEDSRGNNFFILPFSELLDGGGVDDFSLEGTLFQRTSINPSGFRFVTHGPYATPNGFNTEKYFIGSTPLNTYCLAYDNLQFNTKPTSTASSTVQQLDTRWDTARRSTRQTEQSNSQTNPECE